MPILLNAFDDQPLCFGSTWEVQDEVALASIVARLMLGDFLHAEQILAGAETADLRVSDQAVDVQIRRLTMIDGEQYQRWHRDGWIFQLISWVAAIKASEERFLVRAPQPRIADKGFDEGLNLELFSHAGTYGRTLEQVGGNLVEGAVGPTPGYLAAAARDAAETAINAADDASERIDTDHPIPYCNFKYF
jgi:hypothetical protein